MIGLGGRADASPRENTYSPVQYGMGIRVAPQSKAELVRWRKLCDAVRERRNRRMDAMVDDVFSGAFRD
jgi:hypothetical protein